MHVFAAGAFFYLLRDAPLATIVIGETGVQGSRSMAGSFMIIRGPSPRHIHLLTLAGVITRILKPSCDIA